MSWPALEWALRKRLPAPQKSTLVCLANRHNPVTGQLNPSLELLADEAGLSRSGVRLALSGLERNGLMTVRRQANRSNRFALNITSTAHEVSAHDVTAHEVIDQQSRGECLGVHEVTPKLKETKSEKKRTTPKAPLSEVILPACIDPQAWNAYEALRKKKRAEFTEEGRALTLRQLESWKNQGHDPNQILNNSTMNGWQGLFEPKPNQRGTNGTNRSNEYVSPAALRRQRSNAAIDAAVERARDADEAGEGFLSESRDRRGNERPLLESVGRDSGQIQDAPFRDGALERFEKVGFLSSPVRH